MDALTDLLALIDERSSVVLVLLAAVGGLGWLFWQERKAKERLIEKFAEANKESMATLNRVVNSLDRMRDMLLMVLPQSRPADRPNGGDEE